MIFKNTAQNAFIWIGEPGKDNPRTATPGISPMHLGLTASDKAAVDRFHAAVAAGGIDNGKPGWRGLNVYAAFVLDPDGNNIEADWRP